MNSYSRKLQMELDEMREQ